MQNDEDKPWLAERIVDVELAASVIGQQFRRLRDAPVKQLAEGWDNVAFLVSDEWVFRFPRRALAVELLQAEARILPRLAPELPLPVVVPEFLGTATSAFPWPFVGYRLLAGTTACRARPSDAERCAAAPKLAEFLRALHDLDPTSFDAPPDTLRRADMNRRRAELLTRIANLARAGALKNAPALSRHVESAQPRSPSTNLTLNHGDLYARHVLLDEQRHPCGIIDWGDVHAGDAAVDLALAWSFLPPAGRREFFRVYGSVDDATLELARLRALFSAIAILAYGCDVDDDALVNEAGVALTHLGFGECVVPRQ